MHGSRFRRAAGAASATTIGVTLVAFAIGAASEAVAATAAAPGWTAGDLQQVLEAAASRLDDMIRSGFARQPAAMLGIAGAAAVPMIALAAALFRVIGRARSRTVPASGRRDGAHGREWPAAGAAWIEIENRRGGRLDIGELTRIGRSVDCDLALGDASVDHTHALIRRTSDRGFVIIDVSAGDGAGVAVNGRRLRQGRLRDGDRIDLGAQCVVFHQAKVGVATALAT